MKNQISYLFFSAFACFTACVGEFIALFVLGSFFPGYSQIKDTMSSLGSSKSPVSNEISLWWIIMGLLFIIFAIGFYKAFKVKRYVSLASWLIALYGLGEGIASGVFKVNNNNTALTNSAIIHDIIGGIGVTAILILPLILQKMFAKDEMPIFYRMSQIVFIIGIVTIFLFLFRYLGNINNVVSIYKGIWQRLFMLNTYIYLATIAVLMIKNRKAKSLM